tara:strand:+ start:706 stop:873 length:168 start_codon:yes stop_codon:yes gene_type:complete
MTDLERLKQCLDDIGVDYSEISGRDDVVAIRVKSEICDDILDFEFRFNGSFFRVV